MNVKLAFLNLSLLLFIGSNTTVFGQIVTPDTPPAPSKKKIEAIKDSAALPKTSEIVFAYTLHNSFRKLTQNKAPYGKTLGVLIDEKKDLHHDFELTFRNEFSKKLSLRLGLRHASFGEKYSFKATDTSFNYKTKYTYLAMPVGMDFKINIYARFNWFSSLSLLPQLAIGRTQQTTVVNAAKKSTTTKVKNAEKLNTALMGISIASGISIELSNYFNFYILPEYRINLSSTYSKQYPFVHKANTFGVMFGLGLRI